MKFVFFFLFSLFLQPIYAVPVEIEFWHSLAGPLGSELNQIVNQYNESQPNYKVKAVYKGEYSESFTSFAAACRANRAPALMHVFEAGTTSMLNPVGIIKPFYELMQRENLKIPLTSILPAVLKLYSQNNQLQAMPFNISIPVIFYNKDVLEELGINQFPNNWDEMEVLALKLKEKGFPCAYTSAYPAWIHVESFARIHNIALVNDDLTKTTFNNKFILSHLERLKKWQDKQYFEYGGRASEATILFTSGRCPLFSQSSGSYQSLMKLSSFRIGMALMPLDTNVNTKRYNNLAGGGAIWIVSGKELNVYKGVAHFFAFLARTKIQKKWHQGTGYLPLGLEGEYASLNDSTNDLLKLAKADLNNKASQLPITFPAQNQVRTIIDEAFEAIFAGIKTPKAALIDAEDKANFRLMRFIQNNK